MTRVSLVTGGSRGIGLAVAEALARAGDRVAITGTSTERVQRAARELASRIGGGVEIRPLTCDVRDAAAVEAAVREVVSAGGGLDVLVNNAGVGVGAPVADLPHDEWRRIVDTNLTGAYHCCKAAIPHLRARGGGWIVNISSLSSTTPFAGGAAYCASKSGLNAFSEALMQELRHDGIRVTCILPGSVATGFSGRTPDAGDDGRLQPEDVAAIIVNLLAQPPRSLPSRVDIRPSRPRQP